jgi:hypothetical protein
MVTAINAVTAEKFDISAALAKPEGRVISRLMALAGVEPPKGRVAVADLDRALAAAGSKLSTLQRLELKVALDKVGVLV